MTLTPLHAAFAWILKPYFRWLSFAALTIGSFVPDLEPLASFVFGWSVFCGWDFPCSLAPDRLILHSLAGALTIDVVLTMAIVRALDRSRILQKVGIQGFSKIKLANLPFYASASIGSVSHVLVDWFHHPANPVFWPVPIDGSYYVDGLLLPFFSVLHASIIVGIIAGAMMAATITLALYNAGRNVLFIFTNPIASVAIITQYLSRGEKAG